MPARPTVPDAAATTELVEALAHEAGNLMAGIRLSAHLMRGEAEPAGRDALAGDVASLATQCGALLALVSPLIDPPARERVRLAPREVLSALQAAFEDRPESDVSLVVGRVPADTPSFRAAPESIHHVLVVLVSAALEASRPKGRVRVEVGSEAGRVCLAVEDRGRPCDLAELRCAAPRGGRELALRVAEQVVKPDRGTLHVESDARRTRAELWLPAAEAPPA